MFISVDLTFGERKGEAIETEYGPFSIESGSHKFPGFLIRSTKYSLIKQCIIQLS